MRTPGFASHVTPGGGSGLGRVCRPAGLLLLAASLLLMSGCESAPTPSPETPPTATSGSGTETPPEASTGEEALASDPVEPEPIPLEDLPEPAGTQQPSPIDESQIPPMPTVPVGDGSGTPNEAPRDAETMRGLSSNQLIGRHYFADAPGAEFRELHFLESIVVIGMRDGSQVAFPADMSGHHPLCADVPSCVVLLAPDGTPTPFYFSGLEFTMSPFSMITRAECRVAITHRDAPWQSLIDVIERNEGSNVAHSTDAAICWLVGLVPYREVPSWWTQRDEDEYQRQRALMRAQRETHAEATGEEIPEHDLLPPPDPQLPYPDPANIDEGRFGPIGEGGVLLPDGSAGGSPFGMPGGGMPPGAMPPTGNPGDMMAPGGMPPGYGAPGGP